MRSTLGLAVVLAAALVVPATSQALTYKPFRTPSKNIDCAFFKGNGISLRCDIRNTDQPPPPVPASCEFDYGNSFGLKKKGRAHRLCVSDAVGGPGSPILAYGETMKFHGIKCTSTEAGLRCVNKGKHGFALSRAAQTLF